jgi:hypothetical protein
MGVSMGMSNHQDYELQPYDLKKESPLGGSTLHNHNRLRMGTPRREEV